MFWPTLLLIASAMFASAADVYFNDFNGPIGTSYPEWTSSGFRYGANRAGTVAAGRGVQEPVNCESPNGKQRFLGEFGGDRIILAPPYDAEHFVRADQTVTLTLRNLEPHKSVTLSFDLYILKSWDGDNPTYGPDRWKLAQDGHTLLDATFSNNFKTSPADLSLQSYPSAGSRPQSGSIASNTLGYTFFGDSIYRFTFTFSHTRPTLEVDFSSSLFEGKGIADESWGLDNVRVSTTPR
jgi:hypothetical protein